MKVLVVVDVQYDFVDGALGTPEARQIVEKVIDKVNAYWAEGHCVIYTQDTHGADYLQTQEGKNLPVPHCIKGTQGWKIIPSVYKEGCLVVEKNSFGSWILADTLAAMDDIESVELIGLCTDICVISNALLLKSRCPEIPISVDASCCAGVTPDTHEQALQAMKMCQIEVLL